MVNPAAHRIGYTAIPPSSQRGDFFSWKKGFGLSPFPRECMTRNEKESSPPQFRMEASIKAWGRISSSNLPGSKKESDFSLKPPQRHSQPRRDLLLVIKDSPASLLEQETFGDNREDLLFFFFFLATLPGQRTTPSGGVLREPFVPLFPSSASSG